MDTPISILQELCCRKLNGCCPEYQLMSVEGVVHAPTFAYRVQVDDVVTTAAGQSKKKAKHAAALIALDILSKRYDDVPSQEYILSLDSSQINESQVTKEPLEETAQDNESNPVGKLQEICMKRRWRPPNYETLEEVGLPHERVFTMVCQIEHAEMDVRVTGTGRSKKQAKRSAAHEMIIKLESLNIYHTATPKTPQDKSNRYANSVPEPVRYEPSLITVRAKVESFFEEFGDDLNEEIDKFLPPYEANVDTDYCDHLSNVAEYTECRDIYTFYPTISDTVGFHCLASLLPTDNYKAPVPIVTAWSKGITEEEAKQKAAEKLLLLFKATRRTA